MERWCSPTEDGARVQNLGDITIQWCLRGETPSQPPSHNFLPVYVYECPENFSTVEYFDVSIKKTTLVSFYITYNVCMNNFATDLK